MNDKRGRVHFWVGLVAGGIVAAAVMFSIYYVPRKGITFGNNAMEFAVVLSEAHGLHAGSPVTVSGIGAGEVTSVQIRELPNAGWRVIASVEIDDGERFGPMLRTGSVYQVARSGLLGEMTLALSPGGAGGPVAGHLVDGVAPADYGKILDNLTHISTRMADFMDGRTSGDPNLRRTLVDLQGAVREAREFLRGLPKF
ncbi:MAG: ABC-type transporter Mla subunit MlaD [Myxococcota bacterium]|jgi:ABC-type transporter Mla subunit MlaD